MKIAKLPRMALATLIALFLFNNNCNAVQAANGNKAQKAHSGLAFIPGKYNCENDVYISFKKGKGKTWYITVPSWSRSGEPGNREYTQTYEPIEFDCEVKGNMLICPDPELKRSFSDSKGYMSIEQKDANTIEVDPDRMVDINSGSGSGITIPKGICRK